MEGGNIILMRNYLFDKDFLYNLDQHHHKELYVKIIALTIDENPIEQIEGRVTGGSINIDGTSSMRRSCSITLVANDVNINDFYWGLNTKFRFEIGVKNDINSDYPDIIWFPQGTYIITSFSTSLSTNSYTINISGKDKMCLLNGEVGGSLPSSIDFGSIDNYEYFYSETVVTQDNYQANQFYTLQHFELANELTGDYYLAPNNDSYKSKTGQTLSAGTPTYNLVNNAGVDDYKLYNDKYCEDIIFYNKDYNLTREDLTIKNIIREAVHVYGDEPYHNIIINDLDEKGLELMEYRGDTDMYVFYNIETQEFENVTMDKEYACYRADNGEEITVEDASIGNPLVEGFNADAIEVYIQDRQGNNFGPYTVAKVANGDTAGYRITDLTYAGDLICNPGESLTSMLDKLVNMLGDFEYYYDLEGRFIFQKKRTYINTNWSTIKGDGYDRYVEDAAYSSPVTYSFEDNNLITSFQNSPDLLNLRNDYSVWGKRKGVTGKEIPIHARYAIDKKPNYYKAFDGKVYATDIPYIRNILEEKYTEIVGNYQNKLDNFTLEYKDLMPSNLTPPIKKANGTWTPGWWDIRDWAKYYKLILNTNQDPLGTMKWYSYNSLEGCIPRSEIDSNYNGTAYTWLVIYNPRTGSFNYQHGTGNPNNNPILRTYYETIIDSNTGDPISIDYSRRTVSTQATNIQQSFIYPFASCSDTHTYACFLKIDVEHDGNRVYFYNPKFPTPKTTEELIEEAIGSQWQEFLESGVINFVDWREIIYQMAKDYYQYNNDIDDTFVANGKIELPYQGYTQDDFLSVLQENNIIVENGQKVFLYPGGYTGYEKYYIDMQGFWRDLYDPAAEPEYIYDGGYYESYNDYQNNTNIYEVKQRYVDPYPIGLCNNHLLPINQKDEIINIVKAGINKAYARELINLNDSVIHMPDISTSSSWQNMAKTIRDNWNKSTSQYMMGTISAGTYNTALGSAEDYSGYIGASRQLAEQMFAALGLAENSSSNVNLTNSKLQKEAIDKKYQEMLENLDKNLSPYFSEHYAYWNKDVLEYPEKLNFWIEFLDDAGELDQFSIPVIGDRPKVVNDNDVRAIYFREIPNLIYQISSKNVYNSYDFKTGYTYINLPKNCENLFTISALGKSAKEAIDVLLYNYSYCIETVTLNTIPVYYLEPNTRIFVHDENSKINGEYIVNRITVPLAFNGMMSIQANKVTERIY